MVMGMVQLSLYQPAASFILLENMKIWCNIQVITYPSFQAKDLEVNNVGVWRGEVTAVNGEDYADGWGTLEYSSADIFNRDHYEGMHDHQVNIQQITTTK